MEPGLRQWALQVPGQEAKTAWSQVREAGETGATGSHSRCMSRALPSLQLQYEWGGMHQAGGSPRL